MTLDGDARECQSEAPRGKSSFYPINLDFNKVFINFLWPLKTEIEINILASLPIYVCFQNGFAQRFGCRLTSTSL